MNLMCSIHNYLKKKNTVTELTTIVFGRGHRINKPSTNLQACVANDVCIAHFSISLSHKIFYLPLQENNRITTTISDEYLSSYNYVNFTTTLQQQK